MLYHIAKITQEKITKIKRSFLFFFSNIKKPSNILHKIYQKSIIKDIYKIHSKIGKQTTLSTKDDKNLPYKDETGENWQAIRKKDDTPKQKLEKKKKEERFCFSKK